MTNFRLPQGQDVRRPPARARFAMVGAAALTLTHARLSYSAFDYQLAATASVAYTDNINNAPDEPTETFEDTQLQREAGFLYALTPAGWVSLVEPRGQLSLSYSRPLTYSSSDAVPATTSDAVIASGTYELTPLDNVGLSSALTRSSLTTLLFNNQAPTAVAGVNNAGTQEVLRLQINQFWARQWTDVLSSQESATYGTQLDLDDTGLPNTRMASLAMAFMLDHKWGIFGLTAMETATEVTDGSGDWNHLVSGILSWNRALDPLTALTLHVGTAKTVGLGPSPLQLIGGASVSQARDFVSWSVAASRAQSGDLQTGRIFTTDSALVTIGANPFETTPLSFGANGGVSRFDSGESTGHNLQANVMLGYNHRYFVSGLSYSFLRQVGEDDGPLAIPTLTRNAVMLTIGGVYPAQ